MADISRRSFLLAGSAALSASTIRHSAHAAETAKVAINANLAKLIKDSPQFLIFGDTDHSRTELLGFMSKQETLATLAAAGVKHILIERPTALQSVIDALADGNTTKQQYIDQMKESMFLTQEQVSPDYTDTVHGLTADLILNARKYGIKIDSIDSDSSLIEPKTAIAAHMQNEIASAIEQAFIENPDKLEKMSAPELIKWSKDFGAAYVKKHFTEQQQDAYADATINERLAHDGVIAADLQHRVGTDKTVIFYGARHGDDFAESIGAAKVKKIALIVKNEPEELTSPYPTKDNWFSYQVGDSVPTQPMRGLRFAFPKITF